LINSFSKFYSKDGGCILWCITCTW
jgi:hypothetical protein